MPLTDNAGSAIKVAVRCAKCGSDNREGRKFCGDCGAPLASKCPRCGASNEPGERFCGDCGAPLTASSSQALPPATEGAAIRVAAEEPDASTTLDGERKTVTALFADIKGSMELMEDLDPEEARTIIDPALKLMIDAAHRYDGYVVQSTGDGIFALFGAPVAHEDHPQRALYAALRMQEEIKRFAERLRAEKGLNLQVRVGANSGEVVVRSIETGQHAEYTPIGHSTSLASRLQALASPGSIAISEGLRKLVEGYFALKALGPARIKGTSEPVNVYEVTGLGPLRTRLQRAVGRGLTKFVGREREMDALKHAAAQAMSGRGQIVAAMAEPGVGKSRLFFEFKATSQSGWMVLETFSVSHGKASAYLPLIDLLRNYFRIAGEDDERTRREKVTGRVVTLDRSLEDTLPYLLSLLGIVEGDDPLAQMDGQIKKRRTLEAIKRILLRESLNQPLMVIFEDLHWIDEQTQELLNLLADSIGTAKILLLVNYRPEYSHQWNSKTYYTQLRLDPLGEDSADEMLSALLGASPAPATQSSGASRERPAGDLEVAGRLRVQDSIAGLKRLIIERTGGNPFFMEETVQVLLDEGALVRDGVAVRLTRPLSDLKIPPTVQAILAARIDRLPADEKDLLQVLAVIGKEFSVGIAKRLVKQPADELDRMLGNLQLGEFIYEQPAVGDVEYTFKHALTQQVAYNSVLLERRKVLHESIGRAIESLFGEGRDEHLEELSYHYSRSSNSQKAAQYLRLEGQQAALRSAYSQAIVQLSEALGLLRNLPASHERLREELATELVLAGSLVSLHGPGTPAEAERSYLRAREIATQLGDDDALLRALFGLRLFYRFRLELEKSRALGEEELASANLITPDRLGTAHHGLAETLLFLGEFEQARHHQARAQTYGESARNTLGLSIQPVLLVQSAWTLWILGYPSQALGLTGRALALARQEGHTGPIAIVLLFLARLHQWVRDQPAVMKRAEELLTLADAQGTPFFSAIATALRGWALAEDGRTREGLVEMRRSMAAVDEEGWPIRTFEFAPLAEMCGRIGETGAGLALNERALKQVSRTGERVCEAELHRIRGELLLIENAANPQEAERWFQSAIEIAQRQKARAWELRATMSLSRLLCKQGKRGEARAMLAEIYGWFTEGFDTADLKDAKALLEELSAV